MTADARLARWLTSDMRALARLVDEATVTALADDEVADARRHLVESLEAADRAAATRHNIDSTSAESARPQP
jgi:hypothetical protein